MYYTYSFEKLEVWKTARFLRVEIYKVTDSFPKSEQFNLTLQLKRAIGSVCTNLAEGSGRKTNNDKAHFVNMSYSSALEILDHLIAAYDLEFLQEEDYTELRSKLDEVINKLNAFYNYLKQRKQ